jgi:hypothetical protein
MRSLRMKILLITPAFRRSPQASPDGSREQAGGSQTLTKINDGMFIPLQPTSGVHHGISGTLRLICNMHGEEVDWTPGLPDVTVRVAVARRRSWPFDRPLIWLTPVVRSRQKHPMRSGELAHKIKG